MIDVFHDTSINAAVSLTPVPIGPNCYGETNYDYRNAAIIVWLRIMNKSKNPASVIEISATTSNGEKSVYNSNTPFHHLPVTYKLKQGRLEGVSYGGYPPKDFIKPIFDLAPYQAVEGYCMFLDIAYEFKQNDQLTITVKTTQKTSKHKIKINPKFPSNVTKEQ